ncbi:acid phosphatase [Roseateles cellulosilyticus]|uniref:Phosphatase PAP2 family protein n=1 Tax=Pelomonas cellulosilytica TaxID=2906762 RepID=A0ABS8XRX4_9BURK|nr:phosphatase PAP2 family protein [Pelomonas sp. P8]MCE4554480.1 phosphatase PAP2 family protein [Pelomonas sp. P8]
MLAPTSPRTRSLSAPQPRLLVLLLASALGLAACGSDDGYDDSITAVPAEPAGAGSADTAPLPSAVAYVDTGATNQRNNPCQVTLETNAGVRVLQGFLDVWTPSSAKVDAGVTLAAANGCAAVTPAAWTGLPGDATDGVVKNATVHAANIDYVKKATQARTPAQALAAYLDDRRQKGYSVSDGMGPLTSVWRTGTGQTTTITSVDANQPVNPVVNDGGNNTGVGSPTNTQLGLAVDFINNIADGSTEPPKRFYKYARPWRWSTDVKVVPALESAKSSTPATDGGFPSGHTAEAWRDTLAMAYLVPQRYQELVARAMEMSENRILAGMHSPLDVMGGRVHATAVVAYSLSSASYYTPTVKAAAVTQAQNYLISQAGVADAVSLNGYAHTARTTDTGAADYDRFADNAAWRKTYLQRLTYGMPQIGTAGQPASVPKGAEVLLETRLPYLSADQRRVVLKTTALDSGYPLGNDGEGWGRLNLFAAADGFGAFNGDVSVTMDATLGGFNARDNWRNDIGGKGRLTKLGSGMLRLAGANTFSGGTVLAAGTLGADSNTAFGTGDVFVKGGTLDVASPGALVVAGGYTQTAGSLSLTLGSGDRGLLKVGGVATIAGGDLKLTFDGVTPKVGDSFTVIKAVQRKGRFASVTVAGYSKVTVTYTPDGLQVRIDGV